MTEFEELKQRTREFRMADFEPLLRRMRAPERNAVRAQLHEVIRMQAESQGSNETDSGDAGRLHGA